MTLEKAIEILTLEVKYNPSSFNPELKEAHKLGIEAMKLIKAWRNALPLTNPQLLPGETKE